MEVDIKDVIKGLQAKSDGSLIFAVAIACLEAMLPIDDFQNRAKCDALTLLKVIREGVYVNSECTKGVEYWHPQQIKLIDAGFQIDICKINSRSNQFVGAFNHGKTWWLKSEYENKEVNKAL